MQYLHTRFLIGFKKDSIHYEIGLHGNHLIKLFLKYYINTLLHSLLLLLFEIRIQLRKKLTEERGKHILKIVLLNQIRCKGKKK